MFDGEVPVFDTVWEARRETRGNASMVFVPAPAAADSILEAVDAGVELVVCITEGIPVMPCTTRRVLLSTRIDMTKMTNHEARRNDEIRMTEKYSTIAFVSSFVCE